jgi:hypothetical protein
VCGSHEPGDRVSDKDRHAVGNLHAQWPAGHVGENRVNRPRRLGDTGTEVADFRAMDLTHPGKVRCRHAACRSQRRPVSRNRGSIITDSKAKIQ